MASVYISTEKEILVWRAGLERALRILRGIRAEQTAMKRAATKKNDIETEEECHHAIDILTRAEEAIQAAKKEQQLERSQNGSY